MLIAIQIFVWLAWSYVNRVPNHTNFQLVENLTGTMWMLPQLMILLEDDLPGPLPKSDQHQFSPQTINT